jgi:acetylornithine deacetylase
MIQQLTQESIALLDQLIATPSTSRDEAITADIIEAFLKARVRGKVERIHNNVFVRTPLWDDTRPTLLMNSHHDTVRPSASYTRDPYAPTHEEGRIYGLGSNDAGASVVSLIAAYRYLEMEPLPYNMLLAISAEEEVMGEHGMRALLPTLEHIDMALVGEPTGMQAAVGERGLVVMDCTAHGVRGHAARNEGVNALYKAMEDIERIRNYSFERTSPLLGDIKMTVTQISAGTQHNVVPDECKFVIDIRTTDAYTNEETVKIVQDILEADAKERSTRVHASAIYAEHPLVKAATAIGRETFVSPTTSDMALMHGIPSLKMGVGQSARSHGADEYVMEDEIVEGIKVYIDFLRELRVEKEKRL